MSLHFSFHGRLFGFILFGALPGAAWAGILDWLLPKHDIQVITVTDTTPVGALRRHASPTNPVFYMAAIAAYDFAAATRKEKVLLWTTKISCPSRGLSMPETLPVMLALAGPNIGRETAKPVAVKATDKFKGEVKIGDPTVVEYLENTKIPVAEVDPAAAKTEKKAPAKKTKKK